MRRDTARLLLALLFIGCLLKVSSATLYDHRLSILPLAEKLYVEKLLAGSPETVIAIDLGTTYSRVGVCNYSTGVVKIIPNDQGNLMTPSLIAFTDSERFIGEAAKNQTFLYPEMTISFDAKRFIGKKFEDEEVQSAMKLVPYKIVNKDGKPYFQVKIMDGESKLFSPEEITAMFLTKTKETAEAFFGKEIKDAVITIPAYFNDAQRQATEDAGIMAGLNVLRLIPEPNAAATAYYRYTKVREQNILYTKVREQNILVFDLGGGTFDVTILTAENYAFEILATNADMHLGGNDFDQRVMEYFMMMIKKHGKDISKDNKALVKLRRECERAKIALSTQHQVQVEIESLFDGVDFSEPLTRVQFEELNNDLFNKTIGYVKKVMEDAGLETHQIENIVLVGGSTKIPKVRQLLQDYFDENKVNKVVDPDIDEIVLVGESSKIPKFRPNFKDYFDGKEVNKGVDPGEAVALGAAMTGAATFSRARILDQYLNHPGIVHFGSFPHGVRTAGGAMTKLILGWTTTPVKWSRVFTTNKDNQTRIPIEIYEGEKSLTKRCKLLGKFELTGIPPAPRGTPRIEITIVIDLNDNIEVKAEDKGTGKSEKITIPNPANLRWSEEELENLMREERMMREEEEIQRMIRLTDADWFVRRQMPS